jgi:phytoene dehydrogenase-like protein
MLGHAMASAALNAGVDLRYNHRVRRILMQGDRASGIELTDGRQIEAKIVVSNLDVEQTCVDLLGPGKATPEIREFLDNWRFGPEHCLGTPSFALHEPPDYKSARHDPDINRCFYTIVGYENAEQVSEYILQAMGGRPPERPAAGIWVNTLWDPSQAPPGKHAMNGWYFFPRASDLTAAEWEELKQTYNGRFLALWEKYAPNMTRDNVIADALYTPFEIEQEMGMLEGDFGHGRQKTGTLDFEGVGDRSIGWTRTGTEGLYLCAGNGVSAGPGYTAFKAIAEDYDLPKIWKRDDRIY